MSVFEDVSTYMRVMYGFQKRSRREGKLTPAARLIYRILCEIGDRPQWTERIRAPIEELMGISGLSRQSVIRAKQQLKNLGYVDYGHRSQEIEIKQSQVDEPLDLKVDRSEKKVPPNPFKEKNNTNRPNAGMGERIRVREMEWARRWEEMNGLEEDMRERP